MSSQQSESDQMKWVLRVPAAITHLFVQLPAFCVEKIVKNVSFDDMSRLRQVMTFICCFCEFMKYRCAKCFKAYSERLLNEGFVRLGRQLTNSTVELKKNYRKRNRKGEHTL
uniref:Uncharacterized protein n=1 Tax=Ditylenchus dipsaci TaxID=166011 RepID=A0A915DXD8_9BILA